MGKALTETKLLWVLLALAALLRISLLLMVTPEARLAPDSADYLALAEALNAGEGYARGGEAELFRVPGYPLVLAALNPLTGGRGGTFVLWLQILLDCLNVWLLATLSRRLMRDCSPCWAMAWQAVATTSMVYACKVLSETLYTTLFLLFLCLLCRARISVRLYPLLGVLAGAMLYLRTITLVLMGAIVVWLLWQRRWQLAGVLVAGIIVCATPWLMRNRAHGYDGFSTNGDITFYRYHAAALAAENHQRSFVEQQSLHTGQLLAQGGQAAQGVFAGQEWKRIILGDPVHYLWLHAQKSPMVLLPIEGELARMVGVKIGGNGTLAVINTQGFWAGIRHYFGDQVLWLIPLGVLSLLLLLKYVCAAAGIFCCLSSREDLVWHGVLMISFGVCLGILGPDAHPRFRVPVEPLLSLYAGLGSFRLWTRWRARAKAVGTVEEND